MMMIYSLSRSCLTSQMMRY